ncbi:unnamed protein product, partial [Mesorhabditis belari]|uniref:Uncharacterized protein n=1 Tax=Mesorhabditis belari TaxID=2138241 RepID=A0AAF3FNF0_9BILA
MEIKSGTALVTGSTYRSNLTIIIILCILLMLSIVGSVVAWNVCWRMKKERLVHEIQMQFLVHFRQQHDIVETAAMAAMQQQQQSFGGQSSHPSGVLTHSEFSPLSNPQQMQSVPTQKRKLYFSTDFFEPNHMINPPPMAEQFLYDLRKMIDVAKERIRLKRHIPQLPGIVEDIEEDKSTKREAQSHSIYENIQNQQESPRSGKSVDSGNESPEESGELLTTSSDGSDEEKAENGENQEKSKNDALIDGEGQVKRLVSGFEAANSPITTPRILQQSRIPTLSPKTSRANLTLGANAPNERVIPIKQIPAASSPSGLNAYRKTKNKGYAVFPVDPMLKKSLPRRPKREAIQQRNREVEKC